MNNIPAAWGGTGTSTPPPTQGLSGGNITNTRTLTFHDGTETYEFRDNGDVFYVEENRIIGSYNQASGDVIDLQGVLLGKITFDSSGGGIFQVPGGAAAHGVYAQPTSHYNPGQTPTPGLTPSAGQGGGNDRILSMTFHDGSETYTVRADSTIVFENTGEVIGMYDWNTGGMYLSTGEYIGSAEFYNDGTCTYSLASGESTEGTYNGSLTLPKEPLDIPTGQPTHTDQSGSGSQISGIDWNSPVAKELLAALVGSAESLPGLAERAGPQALEFYKNIANQSMGVQGFQGLMNELGGRNMLTSSVAENSLANAQAQTQQNIADKAFTASLASTQAQMGVPGSLSSIISQLGGQVGKTSHSGSGSATDPYAGYPYLLALLGY